MRVFSQILIIFLTLTLFGLAKLRFEDRLTQDMVEKKLLQPPIKGETNIQLGQTGAAVALGGLRSLVAAVWNLRAFVHFENTNWIQLEKSYQVITTLQPQSTHYWTTGAWHLHTNASTYYKDNPEISAFRRSSMQRKYIQKGSDFLKEGIRQNPDNWKLYEALARVWSDYHKLPDPEQSIEYYEGALACKKMPDYRRVMIERFKFYTMTRVPKLYTEALQEGIRLYHDPKQVQTPSLSLNIFALQNALNIPEKKRLSDKALFPNKKTQLQWLKNHWKRRNMDFPMSGVLSKINSLEKELSKKKPHVHH